MDKYSNKIHGQLSPSAAYKIPVSDERRCSRVVSDARLRSKKSLEDREIETKLCHPTTGKLFVNSAVNRHLFISGKGRQQKERGWLRLSYAFRLLES